MFARVVLTIAPENEVPALPLAALRGDEGQQYVWVIADGKLAQRTVGAGARDERAQLVEIVSGLRPGEWVLASKFDNLKDGLAAKVTGALPGPSLSSVAAPGTTAPTN